MVLKRTLASPWGFMLALGPSLIWCGEYIGSGEVIIATRAGAILGPVVMWAVVSGIFLKFWIGLCGARYTVVTGEGMIDCFSRVPGPKNWLVAVVFVGQVASAICAVGAVATAAATFLGSLISLGSTAQFRLFLSLFLFTNLVIVALFGARPVFLVKLGSIFDGLLLVPLQALAVGWGLFYGQKKLLSGEAWQLLRPRWYHDAGLVLAFLFFGYFRRYSEFFANLC